VHDSAKCNRQRKERPCAAACGLPDGFPEAWNTAKPVTMNSKNSPRANPFWTTAKLYLCNSLIRGYSKTAAGAQMGSPPESHLGIAGVIGGYFPPSQNGALRRSYSCGSRIPMASSARRAASCSASFLFMAQALG
jgi:hypothetical protein